MELWTVTIGTTQTTLTSTTPIYTCVEQISSDGARDEGGVRTWTLDQLQADSALFNVIDTYAPSDGVQALEDITMEDGELISGASSTGTSLACAVRGTLVRDGSDAGKRWSWLGLVKLGKASGSVNFSGGTYVKPNIVVTASEITADLVFPPSVLTSYMVTPATQTIASTTHKYGKVVFG